MTAPTRAEESAGPWVERPLILRPFQTRFDAGVGVWKGQGHGESFEAALGLPILLELGVRTGYRASEDARVAGSDAYGRLFDHETANLGANAWANPEIRTRFSALSVRRWFLLGIESRFMIPAAGETRFSASHGLPVRMRFGNVARVDTGPYVLFRATPDSQYAIDLPVDLWFQWKSLFFGPTSGVRFNHLDTQPKRNRADIAAGLGAGVTLFERIDLELGAYSFRINDSDWKDSIGYGAAMAVTVP